MYRPRVLLAEDHAETAERLRKLLRADFDVIASVEDGDALVDAAARLTPDVIVTDIAMPGVDGMEAVTLIRRNDPNARIVIVTVHAELMLVEAGLAAGALGYILKDTAGDELVLAVRAALGGRRYVSRELNGSVTRLSTETRSMGEASLTSTRLQETELMATTQTNIAAVPPGVATPDRVETRLGTLNFTDGVPDDATAQKLFDELDYVHAVTAFINGYAAVNQLALLKGFRAAGVNDNEVLVTSGLMDAKCLFLTANADTYYMWAYLDLSQGPLVVETPSDTLGIIDDMWWNWVSDFGFPGADRGLGGKYLLLPPGYTGAVPEGGFYVRKSRTTHVSFLGRAFLQNNDPKPVDEIVKKTLKVYPYQPGGEGSSIASYLKGQGPLGALSTPVSPKFVEGTGRSINTIPPSDFSFWEMLHEAVQLQPAEAMDPEIAGQIAAIGIVKGKPFSPDARMKKILTEALAVANAASRAVSIAPRPSDGFGYYGADSKWVNGLFVGGYDWMTPPPEMTKEGLKPYENDGARKLNARIWFFYSITGITPAMCMRLENVGSQYLECFRDTRGKAFDGSKTYKVTLPPHVPAARFWSLTVYDNQTRSMLDTPQRYPRAGSQSYPSPAAEANADGSTTVYFGPTQPEGITRGNWIQTMPDRGWWTIIRLYSPLKPFFDKSWRPSDIELVK